MGGGGYPLARFRGQGYPFPGPGRVGGIPSQVHVGVPPPSRSDPRMWRRAWIPPFQSDPGGVTGVPLSRSDLGTGGWSGGTPQSRSDPRMGVEGQGTPILGSDLDVGGYPALPPPNPGI